MKLKQKIMGFIAYFIPCRWSQDLQWKNEGYDIISWNSDKYGEKDFYAIGTHFSKDPRY
jgi:hypothetical protein